MKSFADETTKLLSVDETNCNCINSLPSPDFTNACECSSASTVSVGAGICENEGIENDSVCDSNNKQNKQESREKERERGKTKQPREKQKSTW